MVVDSRASILLGWKDAVDIDLTKTLEDLYPDAIEEI